MISVFCKSSLFVKLNIYTTIHQIQFNSKIMSMPKRKAQDYAASIAALLSSNRVRLLLCPIPIDGWVLSLTFSGLQLTHPNRLALIALPRLPLASI